MDRPLLLIDVDGVLGRQGDGVPKDFEIYYREGRAIQLSHLHGPALLAFADRFELVWATAWHNKANEFVAPIVGLPRLPVIDLTNTTYKSEAIDVYAGNRPVCWLDDDICPPDRAWARKRVGRGVPTKLIAVDYRHGLLPRDLRKVEEFARSLSLGA